MSTGAPPELDLGLFGQVTLSRYFAGIALTLCVYDWLILVERESRTVWKAKWSWMKALYYLNRVITLVGLILAAIQNSDIWKIMLSQRFCSFYLWTASVLQLVSWCIANTILTLRIVALYYRRKYLIRFLYFLLYLDWVVVWATTIHTIYLLDRELAYSPLLHMCASTAPTPTAPVIFMGPAIYEFILFSLTIYRALQDVRNRVSTGPLITTLYRDGFYYFAAVFAVHLWNSLAYLTLPMTGIFMGVYFAWSVMTAMSSRVFLNLVFVVHGKPNHATTRTSMSFRARPVQRVEGEEFVTVDTFGAKNIRNVPLTTFSTTISSVNDYHQETIPPLAKKSPGPNGMFDVER